MKLKEGDIFTIPIDYNRIGYGQVVRIPGKNNFIIVIFKGDWLVKEKPMIHEVVESEILFMGYTMDAKLYHKHWTIENHYTENIKNIELPYYKLGTLPEDVFLVNYKGEKIRNCTEEEFKKLSYQKVIAPVRYEKALKAYYGQEEWREDYDELKKENLLKGKHEIERGTN